MDATQELAARFKGKEVKTIKPEVQANSTRYSPCGKILAAAMYDAAIHRWDMSSEEYNELPAVKGHHGWCTEVAFQPVGELAFSADSWGRVQAWPYAAEEVKLTWENDAAHDGWVRALAVSPDGKTLASGGKDQYVRLWSAVSGEKIAEWKLEHEVYCVAFAPDGQTLFAADDWGMVRQTKLDGTLVKEFNASELHTLSRLQDCGGVRCLSINKEGTVLAVGGTIPKNGGTVQGTPSVFLYDVASGERKHKLDMGESQDCFVLDVHLHEAGFVAAITCGTPGKGQLIFWRPEDKEPFYREKKYANPQSFSWRPDGKQLVVAATNGNSAGNGKALKNGKYLNNHSPIVVLQMPDGA